MINTFMRFDELKKPKLYPYTVIVVLSDHASVSYTHLTLPTIYSV